MRCFSSTGHRSLSLLLTFWLSGLTCAIFCLPQASAAFDLQATSPTVKRDGANRLNGSHESDSHACCRRFQKPSGATSTRLSLAADQQLPSSHSCCAWYGQTAVVDATSFKLRAIDMHKAARVARIFLPLQVLSEQAAFAAIRRVWLPDGGGTYLRCCVFLI